LVYTLDQHSSDQVGKKGPLILAFIRMNFWYRSCILGSCLSTSPIAPRSIHVFSLCTILMFGLRGILGSNLRASPCKMKAKSALECRPWLRKKRAFSRALSVSK